MWRDSYGLSNTDDVNGGMNKRGTLLSDIESFS